MFSNLIMVCLVTFLATVLIVGAKKQSDGQFFDKDNTNALRGFWCLVVVLVHIPLSYQNRIQDMIGSFTYIGVTFFFMTSAYGLKVQIGNTPEKIDVFWRKRLPKLLIPCIIVNLFRLSLKMLMGGEFQLIELVKINDWIVWLMICYFFFWIVYKIFNCKDYLVTSLVIGFSLFMYWKKDYIHGPTWCPEVIGFVYGIFLYRVKNKFLDAINKKWTIKSAILCVAAGLAGIGYLQFKTVQFWGDYFLKVLLGFLIIVFVLSINVKVSIGNRVSNYLGNISFEVYLVHGLTFDIIQKIKPDMSSGLFILISLILTIAFSSVIKK